MASVLYQSSQSSSAATNAVAPSKPASLAVGDTMIALVSALTADGSANTISAPAGWTAEGQDTQGFLTAAVFSKVATSSDVAASTFSFTAISASRMFAYVSRFTAASSADPVDQASKAKAASGTALSTAAITPTASMSTFLIMVASFEGSVGSNSVSGYAIASDNAPSWTEAYDSTINPSGGQSMGLAMAYGSRTKTTASGSATATLANSAAYVIFVLNLVPSPLVPLSLSGSVSVSSVQYGPMSVGGLSASIGDASFEAVAPDWLNTAKSDADWTNISKS